MPSILVGKGQNEWVFEGLGEKIEIVIWQDQVASFVLNRMT